ncbi:ribosomal protein L18 [Mactra antiquata]
MNKFLSLRVISPALLDTTAFSCRTLQCAAIGTSSWLQSSSNKDIKVNPLFTNRNPRALEFLGLEPKRKGWKYQAPKVGYYHKLVYEKDAESAYILHSSGKVVITATSKELAKYLYRTSDVSANWNLGRLLARRMLQSGITNVIFEGVNDNMQSEKKKAFVSALLDSAIEFTEPEEIKHEDIPGINYDGYNRLDEKRKYQIDYQKL